MGPWVGKKKWSCAAAARMMIILLLERKREAPIIRSLPLSLCMRSIAICSCGHFVLVAFVVAKCHFAL